MASDDDNLILLVRRVFPASAEFLFDAWTNPAWMAQWFHGDANGSTRVLQCDLRVGGAWQLAMQPESGPVCHPFGKYLTIERPRRLVFTWHANADAAYETTVTLTFRAIDRDTTELVLTHTGLRNQPDRSQHEHGWNGCLTNLEQLTAAQARG